MSLSNYFGFSGSTPAPLESQASQTHGGCASGRPKNNNNTCNCYQGVPPHVHERNYGMIERRVDARFYDPKYHAADMPNFHHPHPSKFCGTCPPSLTDNSKIYQFY